MFQPNRPSSSSRLLALRLSSSALALALAGALASPGYAAEVVVSSGTTVGQQLLNPGDKLTIEAGATVTDNMTPVYDNAVHGDHTVVNKGTISIANGNSISLDNLDLNNSGTIVSTVGGGVFLSGTSRIVNSGLISGHDALLSSSTIASLNNAKGGIITGDEYGVQASIVGSIDNAGLINGDYIALTLGSLGTLNNSATGLITNHTVAQGAISLGDAGTINNAGGIEGQMYGIGVTGDLGALNNSGHITVTDGAAGTAVYASSIGSIDNSGMIGGGDIGIFSNTIGSINNSGSIEGGTSAIFGDTIGSVTNSGLLDGSVIAIHSTNNIASVSNSANGRIVGDKGIYALGSIGSVANAGTITGNLTEGIWATRLGSITNTKTGSITGERFAVATDTTIDSIVNDGQIIGVDRGISADAGIGSITNSGAIDATGASGAGILIAAGNLDDLGNTGTIAGGTTGIFLNGDIGHLQNSGNIEGRSSSGIAGSGTIMNLNNTGTIRGAANGIDFAGINALTNSGLIAAASPSGNAIVEYAAGATDTVLTLNAGSVLIGHVDIHGGTNTLKVGNGLDLALTFDTSVPELIQTEGSPYVVVGNTVYVADMSAFAVAGVATSDLTNAISGATGAALDAGFDEKGLDGQARFWLQAIGGLGYDGATDMDLRYGGAVAGVDFGPDAVTRFGAFGGASRGAVGDTSDVSSFYAGVYGAAQFEDFSLKGALTAGGNEADTDRLVANNTVATGIETASSTQDAFFIAPSLLISRPWQTQDFGFVTSLGLSYTGVFGAGFTENQATGLVVDGYDTHIFQAQGLVRLPFEAATDGGTVTGDTHFGLEGRAVVAPDITGSLAGTAMTLASSNTQATAGAVAGASLTYALTGGASFSGGIDAVLRTDGSAVLSANVGLKAEF